MAQISAFAAYQSVTDPKVKKKNNLKGKFKRSKRNSKVLKKKPRNQIPPVIVKDDVYGTDEEGFTYQDFIENGLELCGGSEDINEATSQSQCEDKFYQDKSLRASQKVVCLCPDKCEEKQTNKVNNSVKNKKKKSKERKIKPKANGTPRRPSQNSSAGNKVNKKVETKTASPAENAATIALKNVFKTSSVMIGENYFRWLISPITLNEFFTKFWERNTLLVRRTRVDYYSMLISLKSIDEMLLENHVEFTKNIDITTYENGVRETHNPEGRALPPAVWDFYNDGCSIRLLNPQTFLKPLHELCATLQEYFHCMVGANVYLTPPNSQGFAPHYDDIEAFVLQIEGRKRWKVYSPRSPSEVLPRYSSQNFAQEEIGEPILEETLLPGDILYFPRGAIHQASTEPGYHSLHITLSVYQKQSYADLLEKLLPAILKKSIDNNVKLRRGLPLHIWHNAGLAYSDTDSPERNDLLERVTNTLDECLRTVHISEIIDTAVDELAKKFQHEALPPYISKSEKPKTIFGLKNTPDDCGGCQPKCPIEIRTNVRLLRANILRLVSEERQYRIYYYLDNSKEYCEFEPNFFEIEPSLAGSVEVLIRSYPQYVSVSQLPLEDDESKLDLAICLWKRGLLMTEKPIPD